MAETKPSEQPAGELDPSHESEENRKDDLHPASTEPPGRARAKNHPTEGSPRENDRVGVVSDPDFVGRHD